MRLWRMKWQNFKKNEFTVEEIDFDELNIPGDDSNYYILEE